MGLFSRKSGSKRLSLSSIADHISIDISGMTGGEDVVKAILAEEISSARTVCVLIAQYAKEDLAKEATGFPGTMQYIDEVLSDRAAHASGTPSSLDRVRSLIGNNDVSKTKREIAAVLKEEIGALYAMDIFLYPEVDDRIIDYKLVRDNFLADIEEQLQ